MMNIIELAKEAGAEPNYILLKCEALEHFAALVRAEVEAEWVETNKALAKEIIELKKAEPVKQEPVGVVESSEEWGVAGVLIAGLPIGTKLYAAPVDMPQAEPTSVDVKAIRAEALEEAVKVCESFGKEWFCEDTTNEIIAAIRGLK